MNRMERIFGEMLKKDEKILVAYFPLCDPALEDQVAWAGKYFANGATVLEMGLPYEDPCLDGKTVRDSMDRALAHHSLDDAFETIRALRKAYPENILQVMTYYEIIDKMGVEAFAQRCADCGADAVLSPNVPAEKRQELDEALSKYDLIDLRFSPYHLTDAAEADLKAHAKGYIFQQAVDGATGPQKTVSPQAGINAARLKSLGITTPVLGGFGLSNAEQVAQMKSTGVDGVIVGSAIITAIQEGHGEAFIQSLREALK